MNQKVPIVEAPNTRTKKTNSIAKKGHNQGFPFDDLLKPNAAVETDASELIKTNRIKSFKSFRTDKDGQKIPLKAKEILDTRKLKEQESESSKNIDSKLLENDKTVERGDIEGQKIATTIQVKTKPETINNHTNAKKNIAPEQGEKNPDAHKLDTSAQAVELVTTPTPTPVAADRGKKPFVQQTDPVLLKTKNGLAKQKPVQISNSAIDFESL